MTFDPIWLSVLNPFDTYWQIFLNQILMKHFWLLANFGVLQRAPD